MKRTTVKQVERFLKENDKKINKMYGCTFAHHFSETISIEKENNGYSIIYDWGKGDYFVIAYNSRDIMRVINFFIKHGVNKKDKKSNYGLIHIKDYLKLK